MNWNHLESEAQLHSIIEQSHHKPQAIFKHSTRCSISSLAKRRLENGSVDAIDFHYLDLIANRNLSNLIAETFDVFHESPQILLVKNGECIFDESHGAISLEELEEVIG